MYTSDTRRNDRRRLGKVFGVFLLAALVCVAVTEIYALFGHGIRSDAMDCMFLYPLVGGAVYALLGLALPGICCRRLAFNVYCSAIATLTVGSLLKGIFDIAGTASDYQAAFMFLGWLGVLVSALLFLKGAYQHLEPTG